MRELLDFSRRPVPRLVVFSLFVFILVLVCFPVVALFFSATILVASLLLCGGRLTCLWAKTIRPEARDLSGDEFVSIHIATYSEPPEVVIETLNRLAALEDTNYEVIVLDNNTPDPSLYLPVREHCRRLGNRFRFHHFDEVRGAKAGALNISLRLTHPEASKILVLDADYHVNGDILRKGLAHFVDSSVALVQFPQAYRNSDSNCGLTWDYRLFFEVYMSRANSLNTVLSTGTAAFVCKHALIRSGGWSGATLTEDAELGLRLHRHGYRTVYVPEVVAAGLMPTDLAALKAQRRRWVLGNAQSLRQLFKEPNLPWNRKAMMFLQLTAWANPLLPSLLALVGGALVANLTGREEAHWVASLGALSILLYLAATLLFFLAGVRRHGGTLSSGLHAFMAHLGTLWEGAASPAELFVRSDKSFVRTDKFLHAPERFALFSALFCSLLCGTLGVNVLLSDGCPWCAFFLSFVAVAYSGKAFLQWNLHAIRHRTVALTEKKAKRSPSRLAECRPGSVEKGPGRSVALAGER